MSAHVRCRQRCGTQRDVKEKSWIILDELKQPDCERPGGCFRTNSSLSSPSTMHLTPRQSHPSVPTIYRTSFERENSFRNSTRCGTPYATTSGPDSSLRNHSADDGDGCDLVADSSVRKSIFSSPQVTPVLLLPRGFTYPYPHCTKARTFRSRQARDNSSESDETLRDKRAGHNSTDSRPQARRSEEASAMGSGRGAPRVTDPV